MKGTVARTRETARSVKKSGFPLDSLPVAANRAVEAAKGAEMMKSRGKG